MGLFTKKEKSAPEQRRWEAFEHDGQWFVIGPGRRAVSSPTSQFHAKSMAKSLNAKDDAIDAFVTRESNG